MYDPTTMGLLAIMGGGQNPELFKQAMMAQGASPQGLFANDPMQSLGGFLTPSMGDTAMPPMNFSGMSTAPQGVPVTMPGGGAPGGPGTGQSPAAPWQKGVQYQPPDRKPIMSAGVSGSAKPNEGMKMGLQGNPQLMQMLSLLLGTGRADPLRVPNLGSLLGR